MYVLLDYSTEMAYLTPNREVAEEVAREITPHIFSRTGLPYKSISRFTSWAALLPRWKAVVVIPGDAKFSLEIKKHPVCS